MDTGLFGTWFWTTWFSFDHIHLEPERIGESKSGASVATEADIAIRLPEYLQYRFEGRKCHYARNKFIVPWLIQIPYYIYLGDKRQEIAPTISSASQSASFRLEHGLLTPVSPWQKANAQEDAVDLADFSLGASALDDATHQSVIAREVVKQRAQSTVSHLKSLNMSSL
jgi:hypothetical protein